MILMISVGPTNVDINTHDVRLGQIYIHLTLLIRYLPPTAEYFHFRYISLHRGSLETTLTVRLKASLIFICVLIVNYAAKEI